MKIYLIDLDNGQPYEDNFHYVSHAFKSYLSAAQHLLNGGYKPIPPYKNSITTGDFEVAFFIEEDEFTDCFARITEMELQE
jgi:hypothetical protein